MNFDSYLHITMLASLRTFPLCPFPQATTALIFITIGLFCLFLNIKSYGRYEYENNCHKVLQT